MDETRRQYAPTGTLRVALNHGNPILVGRDAGNRPQGIAVDLANALAGHLDLSIAFVDYQRAIDVSDTAAAGVWDVCFLAVDPKRAETLDFTEPYVRIDGRYLAGPACPAASSEDLVASGAKIGTVIGSAYTLTLERLPGREALVHFPGIRAALAALDAGDVAAVAGIGAVMEAAAAVRPGARVLSPPFMEIRQAMAIVKGRPAAARDLRAFLSARAAEGVVADILERHGLPRDCAILPAGPGGRRD